MGFVEHINHIGNESHTPRHIKHENMIAHMVEMVG